MSRAVSSVVGVVTLLAVTVFLSVTVLGAATVDPVEPAPTVRLELTVDATTDRIELIHRGGAQLDISALRLRVSVDGEPLTHQPPTPFFAARGFHSGPEGALNTASPNRFETGEQTSFEVASTNSPAITAGSAVSVRVLYQNATVVELETTAT